MKLIERRQALALRRRGYSLKEISERLLVAKSSVSLWVKNIKLGKSAEARLMRKVKLGQIMGANKKRAQTRATEQKYLEEAQGEIKHSPDYQKIICAMLHWCEGTKNPKNGLTFTNSDPALIAKFLELLRKSFDVDEKKFHPCIHLHSYHSPARQLDFWSKITKISKNQFIKPYLKSNSGERIHDNYQGCISIRYRSNDFARRVMAIAKAFLEA